MNKVFEFEFDSITHDLGEDCDICWAGYPAKCHCGGWLHAHFGDYWAEDQYYLVCCCEKCGNTFQQ